MAHEEKHIQLGTDPNADDRTEIGADEVEGVWATATTVEQFKDDIEILREAGWPVGD